MEIKEKFGFFLKDCLSQKKISQRELAERLGVSQPYISQVLSGKNMFSPKQFAELKIALHLCQEDQDAIDNMYLELKLGPSGWPSRTMRQESPQPTPDTINNTPELRECIKDGMMRNQMTSAAALASAIGYDSSHTLERLLEGKLNFFPSMLSAILAKLHIEADRAPMTPRERMMLDPTPFSHGAMLTRPIPVYELANAAEGFGFVNGCIEPVEKYWEGKSLDTTPVPIDGREWSAFRVTGESMSPLLMDGDIVLCESCRRPTNGKVAVVCFSETYTPAPDTCVVKIWHQHGDTILLTSVNPCGETYPCSIKDIVWCAVAVERKGKLP